MTLKSRLSMLRYELHKVPQRTATWVAWHLPRPIAYWAAIRVAAHATTGPWSHVNSPGVTIEEMLKRWEAAR